MSVSTAIKDRYESAFNSKIDAFKTHSKYEWLRKYADDALTAHTGIGFSQIKAADFMDRIIAMPIEYIQNWLDGNNDLLWTPEYEKNLTEFKKSIYLNK